jgi:hypothetical protein
MPTGALTWALETPTGHPFMNLVLIRMAAGTTTHFGNWIYRAHRGDLAASCSLDAKSVDQAIEGLRARRLIAPLELAADGEAWVCFPRKGVDLDTLAAQWRNPKKSRYSPPAPDVRLAVYRRDGFRCLHCGWAPEVPEGYDGSYALGDNTGRKRLELDHKTPRSAGGRSEPGNLQTLCGPCNSHKGAKV